MQVTGLISVAMIVDDLGTGSKTKRLLPRRSPLPTPRLEGTIMQPVSDLMIPHVDSSLQICDRTGSHIQYG